MPIFSVILIIFSYLRMLDYLQVIKSISTPLQIFCSSLLSGELHHMSLYRAIACGTKPDPDMYASLKTVSLWHLLIVSGGHFTALAMILNKIKPVANAPILKNAILLFFCLWTGFQEPAFFSFAQILFGLLHKKYRINIHNDQSIIYSGTICLLAFPSWCISYSFLLSWLCRLAILIVRSIKSLWIQGLVFYLILLPLCSAFGFVSPQSIIWNCLFGPLLSFLLFPLSILIMVLPQSFGLGCDTLVDLFLKLISLFQNGSPAKLANLNTTHSPDIFIFWCYLIGLHLMFFIYTKTKKSTQAIEQ